VKGQGAAINTQVYRLGSRDYTKIWIFFQKTYFTLKYIFSQIPLCFYISAAIKEILLRVIG
jgi:hypothetical protein